MRRFYIVKKSFWESDLPHPMNFKFHVHDLFSQKTASHWVPVNEEHLLLSTDFDSESAEEYFNTHEEVVHLHHPKEEKSVPLGHLHTKPEHAHKHFKKHHMEMLKSALGVTESHTIWDLHDAARQISQLCRLSNTY